MLRLSRKVDYGLAFLSELARRPSEWVSLSAVSRDRKISSKFLSQLAVSLRGAGLISSREGINGGYKLSRGAKMIPLNDIVAALEGDMALVDCLAKGSSHRCPIEKVCPQRSMWNRVQGQFDRTLAKIKLSDIVTS